MTAPLFILEGLECMAPESLLDIAVREWPEGLTGFTINRRVGAWSDSATLTGTYEAIVNFYRQNWGGGDPESEAADLERIELAPVDHTLVEAVGRYEVGYHSSDIHCPHVAYVQADGEREDLFDLRIYHIEDGPDDGAYLESLAALQLMVARANASIGPVASAPAAPAAPVAAAVADLDPAVVQAHRRRGLEALMRRHQISVNDFDADCEEDLRPYFMDHPAEIGRWACVTVNHSSHGYAKTFILPVFADRQEAEDRATEYATDDIFEEIPVEVVDLDESMIYVANLRRVSFATGGLQLLRAADATAALMKRLGDEPVAEADLRAQLVEDGLAWDVIEKTINEAHAANTIRWVAFRGWVKGGRPS